MLSNASIAVLAAGLERVQAIQELSGVDTTITKMCIQLCLQYAQVYASAMLVLAENEALKDRVATLTKGVNND